MKRLLRKFAIDQSDIMYHERQVEFIKPYLNSYDAKRIEDQNGWLKPGERGGWDTNDRGSNYNPYRSWRVNWTDRGLANTSHFRQYVYISNLTYAEEISPSKYEQTKSTFAGHQIVTWPDIPNGTIIKTESGKFTRKGWTPEEIIEYFQQKNKNG